MLPIILTNAFLRPRGTRTSQGVSVCEQTNVYACVEEMIGVITQDLGASPLMLPSSFDPDSMEKMMPHIHGIFLPGAVSNVHPSTYGDEVKVHPQTFDPAHDAMDLFLVRMARTHGIPFFGICRSMQAMNVAFGGTLYQKLADSAIDHCCSYPCDGHDDAPVYMHEAQVDGGGLFARLFNAPTILINSMHEQAVDRVGEGLRVEARASDGVIEALSWPEAPHFFAGVQWHPEAMPKHAVSQTLFTAFRDSVRNRFAGR